MHAYSPTFESFFFEPIYQKGSLLCLATVGDWLVASAEDRTLATWKLKEKKFVYQTYPFSSPVVQIIPFDQFAYGKTTKSQNILHPLALLVHEDFSLSVFQLNHNIVLTVFDSSSYVDESGSYMDKETLPKNAEDLPITTCGHTIRIGGNNCLMEFSFEEKDSKVVSAIWEKHPWAKKDAKALRKCKPKTLITLLKTPLRQPPFDSTFNFIYGSKST